MKNGLNKLSKKRSIFSHYGQILHICALLLANCLIAEALAQTGLDSGLEQQLSLQDKVRTEINRSPASFIPNDEVEPVPFTQKIWLQNVLVEDEAGILGQIRSDIQQWQSTEEYARQWDIKSTGLYNTPNNAVVKSYLTKKLLRYYDKRLMTKVKKAPEGSTLKKVGTVHQALRPKTKVSIGQKVKLKLRAKVLQGKADVIVENPYVDYKTTFNFHEGEINMKMKRDIKMLGVEAKVDYQIHNKAWVASFNRKLTERVTATISSHQSEKDMAFTESANKIVQLSYGFSF